MEELAGIIFLNLDNKYTLISKKLFRDDIGQEEGRGFLKSRFLVTLGGEGRSKSDRLSVQGRERGL